MTNHEEVTRPWGRYQVLYDDERDSANYLLKKITVSPNQRLSLQTHSSRSEHWIVIHGEGFATIGDDLLRLGVNTHIFIPKNVKHRISNTSHTDLVIIELQFGTRLTENDIVRLQDDYGI
jgi:mannose-6-phosphate isomerase-like protein (cupin superfamily)